MKFVEPITWKCKNCNTIKISDPLRSHRMDWCDCGEVGVDLEQEYMRITGVYEYYEEVKNEN